MIGDLLYLAAAAAFLLLYVVTLVRVANHSRELLLEHPTGTEDPGTERRETESSVIS